MKRAFLRLALLISTVTTACAQSAVTPATNADGAKVMPISAGPSLLGSSEKVDWRQGDDALVIQPAKTWPTADEVVFKITGVLPPS